MNRIIASLVLMLLVKAGVSQNVQYAYDNNGNRIQRKLIVGPGHRMASPSKQEEEAQAALQAGIKVYPNPTSDKVMLSIENFDASQHTSMMLLDTKGNELLSQTVTKNNSELDVSRLNAGVYYVKVIKDKVILSYKLVKID